MIRAFLPSDMDAVLDIWLEASVEAHSFVAREFWESQMDDMRTLYIPSSETYVYVEEDRVLGFFSLNGNTLAALFVAPEVQARGIGTQLMERVKMLRNVIDLAVYKENTSSIRFYERCGFRIVREGVDDHTGHPEILMEYPTQQAR